ncbi:MAG TPA: response regulator [Gaiellaceae bacterium]|nr:response regulator [Gaiellaceae bacterium]
MIADDEPALRGALSDLIEAEDGLELVGTAGDAIEAIDAILEKRPDVALVDVRMPGGGGLHVAHEIRGRGSKTQLVALTAYQDRATLVGMLAAGVVGYLVKGTAPYEIVEAIRRAARGQASISAELAADAIGAIVDDLDRSPETAVRKGEELSAALLDAAPDAVVILDGSGMIILVNAHAEQLFGYPADELLGQQIELLLPAQFRDAHVGQRGLFMAAPQTRPMGVGLELAGRRKDGSEFPIDVSLSATETIQGRRAIAFIRDLSNREGETELHERLAERRILARRLVSVGEEERKRIAEDIHDDSIQAITAAGLRLQILRLSLDKPEQFQLLQELEATIQLSITRLRHLVFELRPPALDREGLAPALQLYLDQTGNGGGTEFHLDNQISSWMGDESRIILYKIAKEALTNVRKHAHASSAEITLYESDGGFGIRISDDGSGLDADRAPAPGHVGLVSMRERAELVGGWLTIKGATGAGTTVEFWIPGTST